MEKVIIVTGGTRGIGRATSLELAELGYTVFALYNGNRQAAADLEKIHDRIHSFKVDVSDERAVKSFFRERIDSQYMLLGVVNNAGITNDGYFLMMSDEKWQSVMDINLGGTVRVLKQALRRMKLQGVGGSIVNVSSTSGVSGQVGQANYSASKGAIIALTKSLSKEFGSDGIRINAVSPGFINTDMTSGLKHKSKFEDLIPLQRFGNPEEVAGVIGFLISDKSTYITGKNIIVDGGMIND